jgi:hypothetical protein
VPSTRSFGSRRQRNAVTHEFTVTERPAATAPYDAAHGAACALVSIVLGLTQSLTVFGINNNLPALQGALGATAARPAG